MKLKKVAALCRKNKELCFATAANGWWLGDGNAMYLMEELPKMDEKQTFAAFDIASGDRESYSVINNVGMPFDDNCPEDAPVKTCGQPIVYLGEELFPMMTSGGIVFIDRKYLGPVVDGSGSIELFERCGGKYIAIKRGMYLIGLIVSDGTIIKRELLEKLQPLCTACALAYEGEKA